MHKFSKNYEVVLMGEVFEYICYKGKTGHHASKMSL